MRLAFMTGGSRGLGLSLCGQLRAAGWTVVEYSRTAPHPWSVRLDLSSPESVPDAVAQSLAAFDTAGCTDLLVINNAATLPPIGPASRKEPAEVLANLNANFSSAILFLAAVTARFQSLACRKIIANVSSGAATKAYAGWSLYCAAKAGLEAHIRTLAVEQAREVHPFICVNLDPGVIDTGMQALIRDSAEADFPELARFIRRKNEGELVPADAVASRMLGVLARKDLVAGQRYEAG